MENKNGTAGAVAVHCGVKRVLHVRDAEYSTVAFQGCRGIKHGVQARCVNRARASNVQTFGNFQGRWRCVSVGR